MLYVMLCYTEHRVQFVLNIVIIYIIIIYLL